MASFIGPGIICDRCDGSGESRNEGEYCPKCEGLGELPDDIVYECSLDNE